MCRFFAVYANRPVSVERLLVGGPGSLAEQSRRDAQHESHLDGWGLGYYERDTPHVVRRPKAAHDDPEFLAAAPRVRSHLVLAHIRQASVGGPCEANTHPFHHGCWLFAHNGTVTGFDQASLYLKREVAGRLLDRMQGQTDSELVLYWLLSRFERAGFSLELPASDLGELVEILADSIRRLDAHSAEFSDEPAKLNFLLTDGRHLVASRWRHTLQWLDREAAGDALAPHPITPGPPERAALAAVVVASEPICAGAWQEVPDRSILTVDGSIHAQLHLL